jgi:multidrug efflux system outer membrane protein
MHVSRVQVAFCALLALTGCVAERAADAPDAPPPAFMYQPGQISPRWPVKDWYRGFQSQTLDGLIDSAAAANLDLQAARARVLQADARARQAGAALLPSLDATPNGTYYAGHSAQGGGHEFDWTAMLTASYELDFWGKNRATALSAEFLAAASRAEQDTLALTTLAAVADTYFQTLALQERVQIAEANADAARQLLEVVQARFDAGVAAPVELATQKAAYDSAQILVFDLKQLQIESRSALALLLGKPPEQFALTPEPLEAIKEPELAAGVPSELLVRRPDLYLAEANLRAARADIVAARAAMFPNISLTAGAGIANPALPATVLTIPGVGPSLALGGSLTQPIFDHGRLKAQHDEALAKETELLAKYRSSIMAAFSDVENALAAIQHLNQARDAQNENLLQSERAFAGAKIRYEAGSGDFLTLLDAQRTLYSARDQSIQYRLARLQSLVSLCKALGGGWNAREMAGAKPRMETRQ